jgi:hypothetical protein
MAISSTQILYTQGKDSGGKLIFAKDAEKGLEYFCPLCNTEFILRKSGNTGKGSKRPHFAHKNLTVNCTPETVLHFLFKTQAYELIKRHIEENKPLNFIWLCKHCEEEHSGNLLKKVKSVKLEHDLGSCVPDIALMDENEKVFAAIEVVVSHAPEESTLKFYKDNKIILIQINLENEVQLENVDEKLTNPDLVEFCFNPKCKKCGDYLLKKRMIIIEAKCWKCESDIKIATINSNKGCIRNISNYLNPSDFTKHEIEFARLKGVFLAYPINPKARFKYLANSCHICKARLGNNNIFEEYYAPAGYGNLNSQQYEIGYFCENCPDIDIFQVTQ